MGTKRVGLARIEALIEALKRDLALTTATLSAKGFQPVVQEVVATVNGLTTGIIPTGCTYANITSSNADFIAILPAPVPGFLVWVFVGANGCELRAGSLTGTDASATVSIGGNSASNTHESALPANSLSLMVCTSATTWVGLEIAANNAVSAVQVAG